MYNLQKKLIGRSAADFFLNLDRHHPLGHLLKPDRRERTR
jgi:hypothetical protein